MSHARSQHPNAPLTPEGRRMVAAEATLSGCFTSSDPGTPESEAPSPTGTLGPDRGVMPRK